MKKTFTPFLFFFISLLSANAQPANDNCANAIVIPTVLDYCSMPMQFTNILATEEVGYGIPTLCSPPWSGGQRDVWFMFTTPAMPNPIDLCITINGNDGVNGTMVMPQVAVYRGDCSGFAELICAQSAVNGVSVVLNAYGLDALENYWVRVNDYSVTGSPNSGSFQLCIEECDVPTVIADGMTTACTGILYDTGGDMGNYSNNENITFTICPQEPHNCLFFDVSTYDIEANFDQMIIYDGPDTNSPISAILTGQGSNFQAQAASGCMTIQWNSDGSVSDVGWEATWTCSFIECDNAPPPPPDFMACSGTFFDSGGEFLDYMNNENQVYTICPDSVFTCLSLDVISYNLENNFDNLFIYDGPDTNSPLVTSLTGVGGGISFSTDNCITVQFISDFVITSDGWEIEWLCSADPCPPDGSGFDFPDQTTCTGNFYDSGGPGGNYQNNESWDYTICPTDPHGCIVLTIDNFDISTMDLLTIFAGNGFGGEVLEQLSGVGSSVEVQSDQGCLTVQFTSSVFSGAPGWSGSYTCIPGDCTAPVPIEVTPGVPDSVMIQTILSTGVQVMNVMLNCDSGAYGIFQTTGGTSEIGMTSGIILTSGSANDAEGPNTAGATSTILGLPGDPALSALSGQNTNDACEFVFDVYAPTNMLSFEYVFGSEEYQEWVGSIFNDVFGFFISGPGITGEMNIALVPGTNNPVTIGNINCGMNAALYNCNNIDANNCAPGICDENGITVEYDGFTNVLTAFATVIPCNWYTLRIVIADAGDSSLDSGVFIKAESLNVGIAQISPTYEFSPDLDAAVEGCAMGFFSVILNEASQDTIVIYLNSTGTAIEGIDFSELPDSIIFLPGQTLVTVPINPLVDNEIEGVEEATVTLSFQSFCGSFAYDSAKIIIQDNLLVDVAQDSLIICSGDSTVLKAFGGISYAWTPEESLSHPDSNITFAYPTQSTWYYVEGFIAGTTCSGTDSVYVEVISPQIDIPPDTVYVCERDTIMLEVLLAGGGSVTWGPPEGLDNIFSNTPMASPDSTTTYFASVGLEGCIAMDSVTVVVIPFPLLAVIPDSTICESDSIVLAANVEGFSYSWSPVNGLDDPNSANPTASPDSTTTYTVYIQSSFCTDSAQVTVNITPKPFLEAGPDLSVCEGSSVQLMALTESGGNFVWGPSQTLTNQFLPNPVATPLQTTTYYVTFTDQGCPSTDSVTVMVGPPITGLNVQPDTTICFGQSVTLGQTDADPSVNYNWIPATGLDNAMSANPLASPAVTTVYTLVASNGACTENRQVTVNVIPQLNANITGDQNMCIGETVALQGSYSPNGGSFSWSPTTGLNDPNSLAPVASPTETTTYTLTYSVLNCTAEAQITINVSEDVVLNLVDDQTICIGESIILGNSPPIDGATYNWTPIDGLDDAASINPTATPEQTTTYKVIAVNGECSDSSEVTITVIRDLAVDAGPDVTICDGNVTPLLATGTNGSDYFWSPTAGLDCSDCPDPNASPSSTTTYTVQYYEQQCFVEDSVTVFVAGNFSLNVSNDTTIYQGDQVMLTAIPVPFNQNPIGTITFSWQATTGLSEPNSQNTFAAPLETITYTVTATSDAGCVATASVNVVVLMPTFGIPNAFSPNGDGLNDNFKVEFEGNIEVQEFRVYSRWGELVYGNESPLGWNGKYKGELMPMDVYVYYAVIRLPTGEIHTLKGDVTLLR